MKFLVSLLLIIGVVFFNSGCGEGFSSNPDVIFGGLTLNLPLPNIIQSNARSYSISGVCNPRLGNVTISFGNFSTGATHLKTPPTQVESLSLKSSSQRSLIKKNAATKSDPQLEVHKAQSFRVEAVTIFPCQSSVQESKGKTRTKNLFRQMNSPSQIAEETPALEGRSEPVETTSVDGEFSGEINLTPVVSNPPAIRLVQRSITVYVNTVDLPLNDQVGPSSAPVATAPSGPVGGDGASSYNLLIHCNEEGEVVSIEGNGIDPSPQTYTCQSEGQETFPLGLVSGIEESSPNILTLNSQDKYENSSAQFTQVDVPIDTLGPRVSVTGGPNIIQGQRANFTISLTDENLGSTSYTASTSGTENQTYTCTSNPCQITTQVVTSNGNLTLTVAAHSVPDSIGNQGDATAQSHTITVLAPGVLAFNALDNINTQNSHSYRISGQCDSRLGNVTVNISGATQSLSCNTVGGSTNGSGTFNETMNVSGVTANPPTITLSQGSQPSVNGPSIINDQTPITQAPNIPDQSPSGGTSKTLSIQCNEIGEVLTFSGSGLDPVTQTHTCLGASPNSDSVTLRFGNDVETNASNSITVSSVDVNENPTTNNSSFIFQIDNRSPIPMVTAGSNIIVGDDATFTVTITEGNSFTPFTPSVSSGTVSSGTCQSSPCTVTVSEVLQGNLTLTVAVGAIEDIAGNTNTAPASANLSVGASGLSVNSVDTVTSLNANNYEVSGNCESTQGNVTVTAESPEVSEVAACSSGTYTARLNVTSVTSDPMNVSATQGTNTVQPDTLPENDQEGPSTAPTATAPSDVVGGNGVSSYDLIINCNEENEEVTIADGQGLDPATQNHTCSSNQSETWALNLASNVETSNPNNFTLSSVDIHGNPSEATTAVNIPIDTQGPRVSITDGGGVVQGANATFTVTVEDENLGTLNYTPTLNQSATTLNPISCTTNPCVLTVSGTSTGSLTLTVEANDLADTLSNSGPSTNVVGTLTVGSSNLSVNDLPFITKATAAAYNISGGCEEDQGSITLVVGTPNITNPINCDSGGTYSITLDVTTVTSNPMNVSATQGTNTVQPDTFPENDQEGPITAPVATAPSGAVRGSSYNLTIQCNEAHEEVTITGNEGLNPVTQTFTCPSSGSTTWTLSLDDHVETSSTNTLTLSSADEHGNSSNASTTVNLPVDNRGPRVSISNGGNIIQGAQATFTVTVEDENFENIHYTPVLNQNSAFISPSSCTTNPCVLTVSDASVGTLTLSVGTNSLTDAPSNTGPTLTVIKSLNVGTSSLSVNDLDMVTSLNANYYEISGDCETGQGNVTVAAGNPEVSEVVNCSNGTYTTQLYLGDVTSNPMTVSVTQGTHTVSPNTLPANDQEGPSSAPTATAPEGYVGGSTYNLVIECSEANEKATIISLDGLNPFFQTYTCPGSGLREWPLTLESNIETSDPNNLTISSTDEHNNSADATVEVNIPVDTLGPRVSITNGGGITEGGEATFTITVTDTNLGTPSYTPIVNQTSATMNPTTCTESPCTVTVSEAISGSLSLTVGADSITDSISNTGPSSPVSSTLSVGSSSLSIDNLNMVTSANADSYTISGDCENTQGNVTITVGTPNILETRTCSGERYTVTLNVSNVTSNSMTVSVAQGTNTVTPGVYPTNDQSGPSSAPTATAPSGAVGGSSYGLVIQCNEAGEEVSIIANDGLNPSTQTFTCTSAGPKTWNINLTSNVETGSSNICTLSSEDEHGNSAGATTTVNIPVDTLSPRMAVTHGGNITAGSSATFTVTVTDENLDSFDYTPTLNQIQSSATLNPSSCTTNPCSLTVSGAIEGNLALIVGANSVTDLASNTGPSSVVRKTLTVGASNLSVDSLTMVTGANAADYEISGNCETGQGNVTITAGTPNTSETALCSGGRYTTSLDLRSVTSSPITVSVAQSINTATPTTSPANDQEGPTTAPVATAPSEAVGGNSYALTLICNEANEEVSITGGTGLDPATQDFTCLSSGSKTWNLTLADDVETTSTNSFTLSSQDEHGNSAEATTTVNIPVDTLGPRVSITNGGGITEGGEATFTITVTDTNLGTPSYTP